MPNTSSARAPRAWCAALAALVLAGCSGGDTEMIQPDREPATPAPGEEGFVVEREASPEADVPVTDAPVTDAPVTDAPVTDAPMTEEAEAAPEDYPLHPSELFKRIGLELPEKSMAMKRGKSLLDAHYAKHPEDRRPDPEQESLYRGRRLVDATDVELTKAFDSPEELAEAYLDAVFQESRLMFTDLLITAEEHAGIFWPEFPESRPATNVLAHEAWEFHERHCQDGIQEVLMEYGGERLWLQEVRYTEGIARYRNFNLYMGVEIVAARESGGDVVAIPFMPTLAERNGLWKAYIYKD